MIEVTRDDVVVQTIEFRRQTGSIPVVRRSAPSIDARSWLSFILADGLSREVSIEEMLRWLFLSKSAPEIQRVPNRTARIQSGRDSAQDWAFSA